MHNNVLILEDDHLMATILNMQLEELGYKNTFLAADVHDAENNLHHQKIDLIITDYYLKNDNAAKFIALGQKKKIPVLLVSGIQHAIPDYYPKTFELLCKPYETSALADKINRLLDTPSSASQ